jgi:hypothetical protein
MAKGGVVGLLLGGGLAAGAGAAGDRAASLFGRQAEHAAEAAGAREEQTVYRGLVKAGEAAEDMAPAMTKGPLASRLETEADVRRFQGATNAKVTDIRRLGEDAGEQRTRAAELGKILASEKTAEGLPLVGPLVTQAESAKRIATRLDEIGSSLRPIYKTLDTAGARPSVSTIALRFADEVAAPALRMPLGESEVAPAQRYLKSLIAKHGEAPDFEKLWDIRKHIDQQLKGEYARVPGAAAPKTGAESLRALRGIIDDELVSGAERASTELGTDAAGKLKLTNALYRDLATVSKIAQHQAANGAGRNTFSITDAIAAAHGGVGGLAMTGVNMVRRHLGDQLAAHVLDKVSRMQSVQSAATRIDDMLSQGAKAFLSGKGPAIRKAVPVTDAEVRALRTAASNPAAVTSRVSEALGDLPKYAPKVAQYAAATAQRQAQYLAQVLPKEPPPPGLSFQKAPERPLSDTERLQAQHVIETVKDPTIVLDRLREGRLTQAHVDALKASSPETFLKMQQYIRQHGDELRPELTVQQECQLGNLFGTPLNEASQPANLKAFQASFVTGNQAPKMNTGGGRPMKTPTMATSFDKMENGT